MVIFATVNFSNNYLAHWWFIIVGKGNMQHSCPRWDLNPRLWVTQFLSVFSVLKILRKLCYIRLLVSCMIAWKHYNLKWNWMTKFVYMETENIFTVKLIIWLNTLHPTMDVVLILWCGKSSVWIKLLYVILLRIELVAIS